MMIPFAVFAMGSVASLLLSPDASNLAGVEPAKLAPPLHFYCAGGPADPVCRALVTAVSQAAHGRAVQVVGATDPQVTDVQDRVEFVQERRRNDILAGHLNWDLRKTGAGAGPTLELSVMDAAFDQAMLRRFAKQLIQFSQVPL